MLRKVNLWLSVLFLLIGINWGMNAAAQNTKISSIVDKEKYEKYLAETAALNDRFKWQGLLKDPDFYKRAAAARLLRFEMFKQAFDPRYINFPAQELLKELKFLALNDENLLVRMEAGLCWLVWSRIDIQYSQQELKVIMLPFLRGLTISDPVIKELSFEGSGVIKSFLGGKHNNAEVINSVFHEIKQQLGEIKEEIKEESLKRDVFYVFLSFLSTQQQGVLFDELSIKAKGNGIDINQINELLRWGLQTKDNAICVSMFAHYSEWLIYPEFMPELLELLNHKNANNSGDIRSYAVQCLKLIDRTKVIEKLEECYNKNCFRQDSIEAYLLGADLNIKESAQGLYNLLKSGLGTEELADISEALLKLKGNKAVADILSAVDNIRAWDRESVRRTAVALKKYDPDIIKKLGIGLKSANIGGRETLCMLLGESRDKEAVKFLIECLSDETYGVQEKAVYYLGEMKDKTALGPLKILLQEVNEDIRNERHSEITNLEFKNLITEAIRKIEI